MLEIAERGHVNDPIFVGVGDAKPALCFPYYSQYRYSRTCPSRSKYQLTCMNMRSAGPQSRGLMVGYAPFGIILVSAPQILILLRRDARRDY